MRRPEPNSNRYDLQPNDFIVSKTDLKGNITYCNQIFIQISKYSETELIGAPHNLIRHPDMPRVVFKLLWDRIKNKQEIFAFVKNLSKDGGYYWVFANVTASLDSSGNVIGYYSVRRKPSEEGIKVLSELYAKLIELEKSGGMDASEKYLFDLLDEKGVGYDELIVSLQG
ncbi:MAG: PAS domain-containing protein [Sulfurospirillaceae bacterium]|nr:PAS domain-containing protein [Sulfurospirillaceae bacterium]